MLQILHPLFLSKESSQNLIRNQETIQQHILTHLRSNLPQVH